MRGITVTLGGSIHHNGLQLCNDMSSSVLLIQARDALLSHIYKLVQLF